MILELLDTEADDRTRPNVSGDLPTLFRAGPQFRRALTGYDRFQVDTYVQWAEDELVTADREREHLEARLLRLHTELQESQRLLEHSATGSQFLDVSDRIGSMLAAAADEAEGVRAEAAACRAAASAEAEKLLACAASAITDAEARARDTLEAAAVEADTVLAGARAAVEEAERASRQLRAEAGEEVAAARATGERARADAEEIRRQAHAETLAERSRARQEAVGLLAEAREQRRRADDEAAAVRRRLADEATARSLAVQAEVEVLRSVRSSLESEIEGLESRRSALRTEVRLLARAVDHAAGRGARLARLRDRLRSWSGTPRTH